MRLSLAIPFLMLAAIPSFSTAGSADPSPAATGRNQSGWAEWEAQARITDGDYDGAVQAEQQAETERQDAERQAMTARPSKR